MPRVSKRGGSAGDAIGREAERLLNLSGRRGTTLVRVLAALLEGPKTNLQLMEITPRYSARIYDLRKKGLKIRTDLNVSGGAGGDGGCGMAVYSIERSEGEDSSPQSTQRAQR